MTFFRSVSGSGAVRGKARVNGPHFLCCDRPRLEIGDAGGEMVQDLRDQGGECGSRYYRLARHHRDTGLASFMLPLLGNPLMLQTGAECGHGREILSRLASCFTVIKISALGHSRVLLLGECSISKL